jgi:hypothetical protein
VDYAALLSKLNSRADLADLADKAAADPAILERLLAMALGETGSIRFKCTKIVRWVSEQKPDQVYPFFGSITELIRHPNSFIKWDGITIMANLLSVDSQDRFSAIQQDYLGLIADRQMITAANMIGNVWKIIDARPALEPEVTRLLLSVPNIVYFDRGEPSPECTRIACGHVLDCFDRYFERSASPAAMLDFARAQLASGRQAVAQKAARFLAKHALGV